MFSERQTPDRRRAVFLDAHLALLATAPRRRDEPSRTAKVLDHLVVAAWFSERPPLLFGAGGLEERRLHVSQQLVDRDSRASKVVYNNAQGKAILDWWKDGVAGGYFYNPGIDNNGAANSFDAGKSAMYIESTARLRGHINTAKFQVGTGLYPRPDSKPKDGGNIIGGASLYIMKSRPADEQQAAWEFVKYAMTPAIQAQWQADTGYYPIRKSAYNEGPSKEWATKYPAFLTAINEIRDSPQNRFTNGAVLGVMPQARARTQKMIESVLLGQATSQAALDAAATEMNDQIDKYNKANKP